MKHPASAPFMEGLPPDTALPQLALALDGPRMAKVFGSALRSQQGLRLRACRIDRVKYRPQRNCTVSYVLQLHDEWRDHQFEQRVAARFFTGHESDRRHAEALGRPTLPSAAGPALLHVPSLGMLAHWLPNDAKLSALSILLDDRMLRTTWLPELVARMSEGRLLGHSTTLVQYVPEDRVCARVDLRLTGATAGQPVARTVYVKADTSSHGALTHIVMQALRQGSLRTGGQLRTPQSILWQPSAGLHWQEAIAGHQLLDVHPEVGVEPSARVGEQLAILHAIPVPMLRVVTIAALLQRMRHAADVLGLLDPSWQPVLARLTRSLETGAGALALQPPATLHGDLHPRNILVSGADQCFIDLDSVCRGPAVLELGAWVADALYREALDGIPPLVAAPAWRSFLDAYANSAGSTVDESLLAWSTAYNLLCQRAYRCVTSLKLGRYALVPALLARADAIMRAGSLDAAGPAAGHSARAQRSEAL